MKNASGTWQLFSSQLIEKAECKFLINDDTNYWEDHGNRKVLNGKLLDATPMSFRRLPMSCENIDLCIKLSFDEKKYALAICGQGIDGVKDWDTQNPIYLSKENEVWKAQIQKREGSAQIEFKYILIEIEKDLLLWEKGPNRSLKNKGEAPSF